MVEGIASAAMDNTTYECTARKKKSHFMFPYLIVVVARRSVRNLLILALLVVSLLVGSGLLSCCLSRDSLRSGGGLLCRLILGRKKSLLGCLRQRSILYLQTYIGDNEENTHR